MQGEKMEAQDEYGMKELEFAIFCIENVAARLHLGAPEVYALLTEKTDILNTCIIPSYDSLHTQGRDYIVDDIIAVLKERGAVA